MSETIVLWFNLVANAFGLVGVGLFIAHYSRVEFGRTSIGRATMTAALSVAFLAAMGLVVRVSLRIPELAWVVRSDYTIGLLGIGWAVVGVTYLFFTRDFRRIQRRHRRESQ